MDSTPAAVASSEALASIENPDQRAPSLGAAGQTPVKASTPVRTAAAAETGSRATSAYPEANVGFPMPTQPVAHGHPTRKYLNAKVTGPLLEGMKMIALEKPDDPLRVLGEYLIEQSLKLESSGNGSGSGAGSATA